MPSTPSRLADIALFAGFVFVGLCLLVRGLACPVTCYIAGVEVEAEVIAYLPTRDDEGRTIHRHRIRYGDHTAERRFSRRYPVGHTRPMLYLPDRPSWVASGSRDDSLWRVIDRGTNGYGLGAVVALTVVGVAGVVSTWRSWRHSRSLGRVSSDESPAAAADLGERPRPVDRNAE